MTLILCHRCDRAIEYKGQFACPHCGIRLNNWHVVGQLKKSLSEPRDSEDQEADVNDHKEKK